MQIEQSAKDEVQGLQMIQHRAGRRIIHAVPSLGVSKELGELLGKRSLDY